MHGPGAPVADPAEKLGKASELAAPVVVLVDQAEGPELLLRGDEVPERRDRAGLTETVGIPSWITVDED
jgi:hypothetical protein